MELNSVCTNDSCGANSVECGANGKCVCADLWSSDIDFLDIQNCYTSVVAMYVLWSLNLVMVLWVLYESVAIILMRFENFFEQRKTKKNYTLFQNKGLIAVILYFGISLPSQLIMAVLHLVTPTTRIGFDLFPTLLFFLAKFGFYSAVLFFQGPMLAVTLRGDPGKQGIVKLGYISNTVSSCLAIIIGGFPFITYSYFNGPGHETEQLAIMQAYYFCQTCVMYNNCLLAIFIMQKVNAALARAQDLVSNDETKNKSNQSIRQKVNDLQKSSAKQGLVQGTLYLLFGAVPFLWFAHAYFLPISWLAFPIIGKKVAHQVNLDKRGAKTIMQRLGIAKTSTFGNDTDRDGAGGSSVVQGTNNKQVGTLLNPMSSSGNGGKKVQSSAISETTQMEELLSPDHPSHAAFIHFVKSRHATGELELLGYCLQYKRAKTLKERKKIGTTIMKKFINDDAPQAVDIPDGVKKILVSTAAKGMWVEGSLDAVRGPLVFDIKGNFFAPFEKKMSMNTFAEEPIDD